MIRKWTKCIFLNLKLASDVFVCPLIYLSFYVIYFSYFYTFIRPFTDQPTYSESTTIMNIYRWYLFIYLFISCSLYFYVHTLLLLAIPEHQGGWMLWHRSNLAKWKNTCKVMSSEAVSKIQCSKIKYIFFFWNILVSE